MTFTPADLTLAIAKAAQVFVETNDKPTKEYIFNTK